jgi:Signal transduction histidine kinase
MLVQRVLVGVALAVIVLLAAIASLVTRWVVLPVRHAAEAAQRVSAGHLGERCRCTAWTTSRPWRRPSTRWRPACRASSASSRICPTCSGSSSRTCRTSSGRRCPPSRWPPTCSSRPGRNSTRRRPVGGAAAEPAGPVRVAAGRPARDQQVRRGRGHPGRRLVDVCDLVRRSADDAQQLAERRGSRIEFRLPATGCFAEADRRRVERILRNILVNAVEHGEGKEVVVTTAMDSDAVAVSVRDYGVGCGPARSRRSSTGSGGPTRPAPAPPAAPAWAWPSRSRTRGCTAAGCRPGASGARARCSG